MKNIQRGRKGTKVKQIHGSKRVENAKWGGGGINKVKYKLPRSLRVHGIW